MSVSTDPNDPFNARDMLAQLQSDGFIAPRSPIMSSTKRSTRRRTKGMQGEGGILSPLASEIVDLADDSASETAEAEEEDYHDIRTP